MPGLPVEWAEINAALGQLAFLLATVAGRVGFIFTKFRLIPMGSYSRLAPAGDERSSLELFYDDSNFFFAQSRLNLALKAFVACVAELGEFAEAQDRSFRLPYAMAANGDRVAGDLHVAMGKDAPWTRAMKLVATNVKWLVSWSFRVPPTRLLAAAAAQRVEAQAQAMQAQAMQAQAMQAQASEGDVSEAP
jgi:beclin 1